MEMKFRGLGFELSGGRIVLTDVFDFAKCRDDEKKPLYNFVEAQLAGENHSAHCGAKQFRSSEWDKLNYISYSETGDKLEIVQSDDKVSVSTFFESYDDTRAIRVTSSLSNISGQPITLEYLTSLAFKGIGEHGTDSAKDLYLYRFHSSWYVECQPVRTSFADLGLVCGNGNRSMKRISGCNTGSWSTKEELPQAIIEDAATGKFFMFQIESNNSWYWETGEDEGLLYLHLGGANAAFNQWSREIEPMGGFVTVSAAIVAGNSINDVIAEMTKYRRHIVRKCKADKKLPVIFNEYMHLSWDNPNEERTKLVAPAVAETGAEYYVIDCGWHDECDYSDLYRCVGKWTPSSRRYPSGIKSIVDYIKSLGMKAGLWIEPEIIGKDCREMEEYYGDDCFMYRNGKKIVTSNRKFLDFRSDRVREYMTGVIDRMVSYGINYIKFDYNQDMGAGTELHSDSLGDGLVCHADAYLRWVGEMMDRHPNVIIEACASGGQRMDYKTLSVHPLVSTSDQTDYKKYPYISANVLSAVLPEQAAAWSYPVGSLGINVFDADTYETVNDRVGKEQVVMNMVNAMLGRMHLASAVHLLDDEKKQLVKEGVDYYGKLSRIKRNAVPYFPLGFTNFFADKAACALICKDRIYLAVWNLGGDGEVVLRFPEYAAIRAKIAYPSYAEEELICRGNELTVRLKAGAYTARFIEAEATL